MTRKVVSLVEPPGAKVWALSLRSLDGTLTFLAAARKNSLFAAFVLAITMGLRRGEILGLRFADVDLEERVRPHGCATPLTAATWTGC